MANKMKSSVQILPMLQQKIFPFLPAGNQYHVDIIANANF